MKNWILWFVLTLVFVGAGVTFFILWYKEKKKADNGSKTVTPKGDAGTTVVTTVAPPVIEPAPVITEPVVTGVAGRTVGQVLPLAFGS